MNNTFFNKVKAERKVLDVVNTYTSGAGQLAGLSGLAIHNWGGLHITDPTNSQVVAQLLDLAAICQTLSDRSHETFMQLEPAASLSFEDKLKSLRESLSATFQQS